MGICKFRVVWTSQRLGSVLGSVLSVRISILFKVRYGYGRGLVRGARFDL